jgi:hypothetical protein
MSQFFVQLNLLCSARDGYISQQMRMSPRCRCDNEQEVRNKLLNFVATNVFLAQQNNNYIITRKCQHFTLINVLKLKMIYLKFCLEGIAKCVLLRQKDK